MRPDAKPVDDDSYETKFNTSLMRTGKIFSYTFWRTKIHENVFWSVQGPSEEGTTFVMTQYFGPPEQAHKYQQVVVLTHPVEKRIKMIYHSTCQEGQNHIQISKTIARHFKNDDNSFNFEFKLMSSRRRPKRMI